MNTKRIIFLVAVFSGLRLSGDVEVPAWYDQVNLLAERIAGVGLDIDAQSLYFQEWDVKLQPLCDKLTEQNKQRRELFYCIRDSFTAKDAIIQSLNTTLAEKLNTILDLQSDIAALEAIVAGLNRDLSGLDAELGKLKEAYKMLLELDEVKAQELLSLIEQVKSKYDAMVSQRDLFRSTLQSFYQCAKSYSHLEKTEVANFSEELGCEAA